jgi:adenylate cyclase
MSDESARPDRSREAEPEQVLEALGEVIRAVSSSGFDLDEVLQTIIRHAVDLSRAEFGNILRYDEEAGFYRVIAFHGKVEPAYWKLVTNFPYREDRGSMIGRTLIEKRPVHIVDVLEDSEYTAWEIRKAAGDSYRTMLGIPMLREDKVIGLFVLWRPRVEPFSDREISMLSTFAAQAMVAIDNLRLFQTVERQRSELARFAPQVAALLSTAGGEEILAGHRREITAMFADLRGFTAFAESAEPEEVLGVLRDYHAAVGDSVVGSGGTVEHFAGDGLMCFFNDPSPLLDHQLVAVRSALEIRDRFDALALGWRKRGYDLGLGIGMAVGFATLGRIGFEGRFDYGAVGNVVILASRLSDAAQPGEILLSQRLNASLDGAVATESVPDLTLKGFGKPVPVFRVTSGPPT